MSKVMINCSVPMCLNLFDAARDRGYLRQYGWREVGGRWFCSHHESFAMNAAEDAPKEELRVGDAQGGDAGGGAVNHPRHYKSDGGIEAIDVIEGFGLDFHLGNCVKYVLRAGKKDSSKTVEDLRKAVWYLNRAIEARSR